MIRLRSAIRRIAPAASESSITNEPSSKLLARGHISAKTPFAPIPSTNEGM
jgi:hypothetical protein